MELMLKSKEKESQKNFPKFQSILMQVAKSGVINRKTAARKISKISKNFNILIYQFKVDYNFFNYI